ncbi:hypothetical protein D3C81_303080 [compost metagenome]
MDVYHQSIVFDSELKKLSGKELANLSLDSECAHRALMKGMRTIGSLMVSASTELNDDEMKESFIAIGDLMMHLPRYSEALFENAANADYEIKRREKYKVAKATENLDKAMQGLKS